MPAVDVIVTTFPDRCLRITGKTARVTFIGPTRRVMSSSTTSRSSASPTASATASVFRPVATTAWPAASAACAMSTPIPRPAPVINQTLLPAIFFSPFWLLFSVPGG